MMLKERWSAVAFILCITWHTLYVGFLHVLFAKHYPMCLCSPDVASQPFWDSLVLQAAGVDHRFLMVWIYGPSLTGLIFLNFFPLSSVLFKALTRLLFVFCSFCHHVGLLKDFVCMRQGLPGAFFRQRPLGVVCEKLIFLYTFIISVCDVHCGFLYFHTDFNSIFYLDVLQPAVETNKTVSGQKP